VCVCGSRRYQGPLKFNNMAAWLSGMASMLQGMQEEAGAWHHPGKRCLPQNGSSGVALPQLL